MKSSKGSQSELLYKCFKNPELLEELKKNPKQFIEKELNVKFPENFELQVLEETQNRGYLIIPSQKFVDECSEEELKSVAAGGFSTTVPCKEARHPLGDG